jgi:D-alanine-D-alanine ligase
MNALPATKTNDPAAFGHVGLLVGGESAEREVSLNGGRAVYAALERRGVSVEMIDGGTALIEAIRTGRIDRVFNLVHGPGGEDGTIQGALDLLKVPYTGTGLLGSALSMDKIHSKWVWEQQGINTPPFFLLRKGEELPGGFIEKWGLPLFVKPAGLGSSIGVSKVDAAGGLDDAIALARKYDKNVIIEHEVKGNEYFAGVVGDLVLPLIHIETPRPFYDYTAKYESDETRYYCPCGLSADIETQLQEKSLAAFRALECSGWGRVDFIVDEAGEAWFLEANTTPGMTGHSLVPQAAAQIGIGFDELVWRILESSL